MNVSSRRRFLGGLLSVTIVVLAWNSVAAETPNIVLILADDMGYGDPACYNAESKVRTPSIDRLASQGIRFTDAHTPSSVCSPTRYGLLTGRYCWRTRLKQSVLWPWDEPLIDPARLTLPAMLGEHGYHTACIGKWHLGWNWPTTDGSSINDVLGIGEHNINVRGPFGEKIDFSRPVTDGPIERGFNEFFGVDLPNFPPYTFIENDHVVVAPTDRKPEGMFGHPGPMAPGWDLTKVLPKLAEKAVDYIDRRAQDKTGKSFFLYLPLTAPHTPIAPAESFSGRSRAGSYGDFVEEVDWTVGEVLAAIEKNGLADDTLVVFTSDNGSPARDGTGMSGPTRSVVTRFGHDPSRPWRGIKADIWDGGHRVPFVVRWPGVVQPGTESDQLVCLTDWMATIAAIVGHELPDDAAEDSVSFLPLLKGESSGETPRQSIVHHSLNGTFAFRDGNWKLVVDNLGSGGFTKPAVVKPKSDGPQGQLYNLKDDPGEEENLWSERPEIVRRLSDELAQIKASGRSRGAASGN